MVFKDSEPDSKYNIADSVADALSPMNIIKRIFLFLVFGVLLALKSLIQNIDAVGREGGSVLQYFSAIGSAMWEGVRLSLGSMWAVIFQPQAYIQSNSWGSVAFAIFSLIALLMFFFQPISLIINIIDGKKGNATGTLLRLFVTFVVVIILSCIVFYTGTGDVIISNLPAVNETVQQNVTQIAENLTQSGGSVVNLL